MEDQLTLEVMTTYITPDYKSGLSAPKNMPRNARIHTRREYYNPSFPAKKEGKKEKNSLSWQLVSPLTRVPLPKIRIKLSCIKWRWIGIFLFTEKVDLDQEFI